MPVEIALEEMPEHCSHVPLAVLGYCLRRGGVLGALWSGVAVEMKVYAHTPTAKLQDVLVAILAGCRSLAQVNTRLAPERALAAAWGRPAFAAQATLSRTLDALAPAHIEQLRAANLALLRRFGALNRHDWGAPLILDIDPTSLVVSKRAEGAAKGWVSGKKTPTAATSSASRWRATTRASCRWPTPATATATSTSSRRWRGCSGSGRGRARSAGGSSCAPTPSRGPTRRWPTTSGRASRCS
jgi:hypothetical protein